MKIQVAIQAHHFNKRLCWMLSSILQQVPRDGGRGLPNIQVCLSYAVGYGVEQICNLFSGAGLNIKRHEYAGVEGIKYRGEVRNLNLKDRWGMKATDADWILWADSDMVYHPQFFGTLGHLLRTEYRGNPHCLHSARKSTMLEETEALIGKYTYPCIIPDAYRQADTLEAVVKSNIGAGYCQIANVDNLFKKHGGVYCNVKNADWDWDTKGQKARSDQIFRRMVGRQKIPLPIQIHLQHGRQLPDERDC